MNISWSEILNENYANKATLFAYANNNIPLSIGIRYALDNNSWAIQDFDNNWIFYNKDTILTDVQHKCPKYQRNTLTDLYLYLGNYILNLYNKIKIYV